MNEPSPAIGASRSWLFAHNITPPARTKGTLFVPGAYIRWQLRRQQQIAAGDIVYIVSVLDGGLAGWALVREGTELQSPEFQSIGVHLQILGHAPKAIPTAGIYEQFDKSAAEQGEFEIAKHDANSLDRLLSGVGVPTPDTHPEVVKFRAESAARALAAGAKQLGEIPPLADIGPLAAVEGKWARIGDLIGLKLPASENYFSGGVRTALGAACGISACLQRPPDSPGAPEQTRRCPRRCICVIWSRPFCCLPMVAGRSSIGSC